MAIPLDYDILRLIWWALMGVLLIGFALTDGFDLGSAALLPFVARNDEERRMVINAIGLRLIEDRVMFAEHEPGPDFERYVGFVVRTAEARRVI